MSTTVPRIMSAESRLDAMRLCSRICHDLISPVGALANGIEILADEDDPDMRAQIIEMLAESAQTTSAKLRFFRLVFGASGGRTDAVAIGDLKDVLGGFISSGKADLEWSAPADATLDRSLARATLIAAMIVSDALVRGGTVSISGSAADIRIAGEGPRVILDAETKTLLSAAGAKAAMSSRNAPVFFMLALLDDDARAHSLTLGERSISITIQAMASTAALQVD